MVSLRTKLMTVYINVSHRLKKKKLIEDQVTVKYRSGKLS